MSDLLLSALGRRFGSRLLSRVRCGLAFLTCGRRFTYGFLLSFTEHFLSDIVLALGVNIAYTFLMPGENPNQIQVLESRSGHRL